MKHTVKEVVLDNGAKGVLVHVPDASVMSFRIDFRAGEYLVDRKIWEAPHIMEHLLLGANKRIPKARAFQAEFEKNGAYCNASTGPYDIMYEAECADFEWQRIMNWLLVAITEPLFLEDEYKAEVGNVREELTARSNSHFRHLSIALREAYGFFSVTDQERLKLMKNVSIDDIKNHYKATHYTSNMRFMISGNITRTRREQITTALNSLALPKGKTRKELPVEVPKLIESPLVIRNRTVDNYYFYFDTFVKRRMTNQELISMSLLNDMMTGTLYSRILGTARERGLVYSMSSGVSFDRTSTDWWFGAQVRPDNARKLFEVVVTELEQVFAGKITKDEIDAAKMHRLGTYQRGYQTVAALGGYYSGQYFFDDTYVDYHMLPERIKEVTKRQMVACAKELFSENIWGFGLLGNPKKEEVQAIHDQLRRLWS